MATFLVERPFLSDQVVASAIHGDASIHGNLTVSDTIRTAAAGIKYPDGSVQATAHLVPIGAIIAWAKSFVNTPALPVQFVECNGQVLVDPDSPYNGMTMPSLNSDSRFLAGATSSGTTGGATSHSHTLPLTQDQLTHPVNNYALYVNNPTTSTTSHLPPYYTVVWIMRLK